MDSHIQEDCFEELTRILKPGDIRTLCNRLARDSLWRKKYDNTLFSQNLIADFEC